MWKSDLTIGVNSLRSFMPVEMTVEKEPPCGKHSKRRQEIHRRTDFSSGLPVEMWKTGPGLNKYELPHASGCGKKLRTWSIDSRRSESTGIGRSYLQRPSIRSLTTRWKLASRRTSDSIFSTEWITVVWRLPPSSRPISSRNGLSLLIQVLGT